MSEAGPTSSSAACSGDMYSGVPMTTPEVVSRWMAPGILARPKSARIGVPSLVMRTLEGLMSRWRIPCACRWSGALPRGAQRAHHRAQLHRLADAVGECSAVDQLEHQVRGAVVIAVVKDFEDVLVLEAGDRSRLLLKALAIARLLGEEVGEHLDRHVPVEGGVVGAVDRGHATAADPLHEPVR